MLGEWETALSYEGKLALLLIITSAFMFVFSNIYYIMVMVNN